MNDGAAARVSAADGQFSRAFPTQPIDMLAFRALRSAASSSRALRPFSTKFPPIGTFSEEETAIRDVGTSRPPDA